MRGRPLRIYWSVAVGQTRGSRRFERERRDAVAAAQLASETLTELERRALSGERIAAAERRRVEGALAAAKAKAEEPWQERRDAALAFRR